MNLKEMKSLKVGSPISVKVSRETHRRLTDLGKKNESYDTVIERLLDFYEANK